MIADPQTTVQSENLVFPDQTNKLYKIHISEKNHMMLLIISKKMWKVRQKLNWYENVRLKDELQKMQYLYNDYIEVQKLYDIKVTIVVIIVVVIIIS